jgi:hypothetical protein
MILPTKGITPDRALLTVGAQVLLVLDEPKTISRLWHEVQELRGTSPDVSPLGFDWFLLSLDFLFIIGALRIGSGNLLMKVRL